MTATINNTSNKEVDSSVVGVYYCNIIQRIFHYSANRHKKSTASENFSNNYYFLFLSLLQAYAPRCARNYGAHGIPT